MNEDFFILLLYKSLKGEINQAELTQLNIWLEEDPSHVQTANALEQAWKLSEAYPKPFDHDLEVAFEKLENRIQEDQLQKVSKTAIERSLPNRSRFNFTRIAAAVTILLVAGTLLWTSVLRPSPLIVENTQKGEFKELVLPDGSVVWLNENTSISYPQEFGKTRKIELEGEAFFDVKRNETKPFTVETQHTLSTVLGTSFNLKALPEETQTTLIVKSGKVRFQPKVADTKFELEAGYTSSFDTNGNRLEAPSSIANYNPLFWKTGEWSLHNISFVELKEILAQQFDVKLQFSDKAFAKCQLTSTIKLTEDSIKQSLETILATVGATLEESTSNSYLVNGGGCN